MSAPPLPSWRVPPRPPGSPERPLEWPWEHIPALPPFRRSDSGERATYQTTARLCHDERMLYVRFDCEDYDIWGVLMRHDDPIYDEEAVEIFISAGDATPERYYEIEVSPNGVVWDGAISNPSGDRADLRGDTSWDCAGLRVSVERDDHAHHWAAVLCIPWAAIAPQGDRPQLWRANLYRIERPRSGPPEFSCWSPNGCSPPDFHKPAWFGTLIIADEREEASP